MKKVITYVAALILFLSVGAGFTEKAQAQSPLWVTVYYPTWMFRSASSPTWYAVPPWNMKFSGVTHVIQFGNVNVVSTAPYFTPLSGSDSLEWAYGTQSNGEATRTYYRDSLIAAAHRQGTKVLICIQQAQSGSALNGITTDSATTDAFAQYVAGYVQRHNYDGVDVNWETSVGNKTQTSLLFRRLRARLGSSATISISPLSGGWGNYDAATCNANVNQINPQEYDISDAWNGCIQANGNWPINALHQGTTASCSGTNQAAYDSRGPLQWAGQGFQRSILGAGIASFGRMYVGSKVIGGDHSISRQDVCSYYTGDQLLATAGGTLVQDLTRNADYIVGTSPINFSYRSCSVSAGQDYFFTYQTPRAIPGQVDWIKSQGFGGVMVYDFQGDCDKAGGYGQTNPIVNAIVAAVGNAPPPQDNIKPVVGMTTPANGATVSGLVSVSATATDNVGVTKVEFLIDGAVASSDITAPYVYTWNAASILGSHTVAARAYDAAGNTSTSSPATVNVVAVPDTTRPVVALTSPSNGATVSGTVTVAATASDNVGVTSVDILVDGAVASSDASSPYSYSWNTAGLTGNHTLAARAHDLAGNTATTPATSVTIATPPPAPSNLSPANLSAIAPGSGIQFSWSASAGATGYHFQLSTDSTFTTVSSNLSVTATSVIASALVTPAKYFWHVMATGSGGSSAYSVRTSFTTTTGPASPPPAPSLLAPASDAASVPTTSTFVWSKSQSASLYRIQVGTDSLFRTSTIDDSVLVDTFRTVAGLSALATYYWRVDARNPVGWGNWSAVWECTTKDDISPSVAITYPDPSATLSDSVTVTAAASDNVALHGVQFYVDGMSLGPEVTTAPYQVKWTTLAVANGRHCLKAVAKDNYSNVATSNADSVSVYNAAAVSDLWVYQDSLVPTWFSAAWSGTYDLASTDVSYSPPYSIQCATSAFGGLRLRSSAWGTVANIDPAPYARVEFQLFSTSPSLKLVFYLENESQGTFPVIKYKNFPANQWVTVSCPMSKLNPGNLPVQFVTIQSNCPTARTFYVDDIRFVAARPGGLTPPMDYLEYDDEVPAEMALAPNFPNPFNPTTTLSFDLVEDATVSLKVYNILGQEVATLLEDRLTAGKYQSTWNPGDAAGGVYFARLDAIGVETLTHTTRVRKMLFIK